MVARAKHILQQSLNLNLANQTILLNSNVNNIKLLQMFRLYSWYIEVKIGDFNEVLIRNIMTQRYYFSQSFPILISLYFLSIEVIYLQYNTAYHSTEKVLSFEKRVDKEWNGWMDLKFLLLSSSHSNFDETQYVFILYLLHIMYSNSEL